MGLRENGFSEREILALTFFAKCRSDLSHFEELVELHAIHPDKIGLRLRQLRLERGLFQRQIGEYLGVDVRQVRHWEAGSSLPNLANLVKAADFFDVSTDYLCGRCNVRTYVKPVESLKARFGKRLKMARWLKGVTSMELCKALAFHNNGYSRWENGRHHPRDINKVVKVANYLGVSLDYLSCRSDVIKLPLSE